MADAMTPDDYFSEEVLSKQLFELIRREMETVGEVGIRVTKSQIAFQRRRTFAWVWMPGQYLKGRVARLVLTLALPWRDASPRWKEVVEPRSGWFMHHLELNEPSEFDEEVIRWLRQAWEAAI